MVITPRKFIRTKSSANLTEFKMPERSTSNSVGYDIYYNGTEIINIPAGGITETIPLGIKVQIPTNEFLMIVPRSSLGWKRSIRIVNSVGIIDSDYFDNIDNEGEINAKFHNFGNLAQMIKPGEKILQGIFLQYGITVDDAANKQRNGGIGSTGA